MEEKFINPIYKEISIMFKGDDQESLEENLLTLEKQELTDKQINAVYGLMIIAYELGKKEA